MIHAKAGRAGIFRRQSGSFGEVAPFQTLVELGLKDGFFHFCFIQG